ncbi:MULTISPECIES: YlbF family regulator [unclassified Haladaptatus]|uniref:YlbF family regulator n=1 Tax=unclassified Haladaptatus TaxID=2622732 RepID=UPI0023E876A9|nr:MULTISPECIES: YlbF family regulator [unclassified Haladaptatus]
MSVETARLEDMGTELGKAIAESPEYKRFEETKEAVENSEEAQRRVQEFEQLRQEFMLARQSGEATQEDLHQLQNAQADLHDLPVMDDYLSAQADLDAKLAAVNDAISAELAVDFGEKAGGCCQD